MARQAQQCPQEAEARLHDSGREEAGGEQAQVQSCEKEAVAEEAAGEKPEVGAASGESGSKKAQPLAGKRKMHIVPWLNQLEQNAVTNAYSMPEYLAVALSTSGKSPEFVDSECGEVHKGRLRTTACMSSGRF